MAATMTTNLERVLAAQIDQMVATLETASDAANSEVAGLTGCLGSPDQDPVTQIREQGVEFARLVDRFRSLQPALSGDNVLVCDEDLLRDLRMTLAACRIAAFELACYPAGQTAENVIAEIRRIARLDNVLRTTVLPAVREKLGVDDVHVL